MEWWKRQYVLCKMIVKYGYLLLLQKLYQTVRPISRHTYEISYVLHDKTYRFRTKVQRGPSRVVQVTDETGDDITEEIRSYMGPNEDFHGQSIRTCDIGCELISMEMRNGDTIVFGPLDTLRLEKESK